jgi:hypothetical protein
MKLVVCAIVLGSTLCGAELKVLISWDHEVPAVAPD